MGVSDGQVVTGQRRQGRWLAAATAQATANDNPLLPRGVLGIPVQPSTYLGGHNMMNQDGAELPPSPIT